MHKSKVKIKRQKKARKIFLYIFILFLLGNCILFGTSYGHQLRVEVAETILTTEHRYLAKYTLLSQEELNDLLDKINNPKWMDSKNIGWEEPFAKKIEKRKKQPLDVKIQTIYSTETAEWKFVGKLITINNPFTVKLVIQQGTQGSDKGEQLSVMAKRNHALVAVNANGFSDETGRGGGANALGISIANGKVVHKSDENDSPALVAGLTKYGEMITGKYSVQNLLDKQVISAAGFMPQLIVNGEKLITEGNGHWGSAPRTIMGQKKDGSIMFLVIDGRQYPYSVGATLRECQDILYENGAINAMAMDGGASTALYAMGQIINKPATSQQGGRFIPDAWIVTADESQNIRVTIDGKEVTQDKIEYILES